MNFLTAIFALHFFISANLFAGEVPSIARVSVYDAKMPVPLAGVKDAPIYMRIQNNNAESVVLTRVASAYGESFTFFQKMENGEVKAVDTLTLPANSLVNFESTGSYVLLKGLKASVQSGDKLHLVLTFNNKIQVDVSVLAISAYDLPHH